MDERHLELARDDLRERCLAEARRAGEQEVVQRLAAAGRGLDRDGQLFAQRVLADELLEPLRAQRAVELVVGEQVGGLDALCRVHQAPALVARSAYAMSSSALSASAPASSCSASAAP